MTSLALIQPDDWHCHLRDDEFLTRTVNDTANQFQRAIVMPNLTPPVTTVEMARDYRARIMAALDKHKSFQPLMTLYLTPNTTPEDIEQAAASDIVTACKLYPQGATTNSAHGVDNIEALYPVFEMMMSVDLPLLIHGESTDQNVDVFDREKVFLNTLNDIHRTFPKLRIVLEHITSKAAVEFIEQANEQLAATITAHHLMLNRNDLFQGGIRPHHYCLPILKRQSDQAALIQAAISGNPKFFLGTDSAPHIQSRKESSCGCAGIYTAFAAMEFYAQVFEENHALNKLEGFSSIFGPQFYQLPVNERKIQLVKESWVSPDSLPFGDHKVVPFKAKQQISWKVIRES